MANLKDKAEGTANAVRRKVPFGDHLVRAFSRYQADDGDRQAAAVTYFAFLSFFPLVALAFSVTGFLVDAYPDLRRQMVDQINQYLPGLAGKLNVEAIGNAKVGAGILGLAGLLYVGLGWIDALRAAIRMIWHHNVQAGNVVVKKLRDVVVLAGLGVTLLASLAVSGVATSATRWFLELVGLERSTPARWVTTALAIGVAVLVNFLVFLYLFTRLPRLSIPLRRVAKGALLGAVGMEILKVVGTYLVGRTTKNPVYGTFAVVVGLLIWINLVSRFTLFVAAWTVTAPFDTDVPPSGTASPGTAREAGVPEEYADRDPDHVPTTVGSGAPARLAAVLAGRTPPQDQPQGDPGRDGEASRGGRDQGPRACSAVRAD